MSHLQPLIQAATRVLATHGITPDRCDVLQDGSTLVLRLSETLVARIVKDTGGARQGTQWFARENAIAQHLTEQGAPVIPLHPALPPGPHESDGYPMNFWEFVTRVEEEPSPEEIGKTLHQCHAVMRSFPQRLPSLAIISESLGMLPGLAAKNLFPDTTLQLLHEHLSRGLSGLASHPQQPLHGDAHMGNLMNTTRGLLWTDWEDTFSGPVEWDLCSVIWNARILDEDEATAHAIQEAYEAGGTTLDAQVMHLCMTTRGAVMTAWYPLLYPEMNADRRSKLARRLTWLEAMR
jgi:hypothetical protein